ncbi:MAG: cytochrome c-type biogenesis protein CcmH [Gemmatimonadetes bacterium]|nr:MAG: cytochrome c-type biogenesis protein CcmH [Gemmatimonadota bacterium]
MSRRRLLGTVVVLLAAAAPVAAQEPLLESRPQDDPSFLTDTVAAVLDARTAEIADQLRCPVCSGQSVLESNSSIAQEMQAVIRERLGQGENEEQILSYFVGSYGDWIILKPRPIGLNLLVYLLPAGALIFGAGWLMVMFRKWSGAATTASDANLGAGLNDDDERWLRDAMGRE